MRLAAIYIQEHQFLFDKPQTINFAGEYFYEFSLDNNKINISRSKNNSFIEDFFNLEKLDTKITNINAIVGQNGSGKSSVLDVIRAQFINKNSALPHSSTLFVFEDISDLPIILTEISSSIYFKKNELIKESNADIQTIFYSPNFDYKFNINFDEIDDHDISFDKILEEDLSHLEQVDSNQNGWGFTPSQELLFRNSLRHINFMSSDLVSKNKIFQDIFNLNWDQEYNPILTFRGYTNGEEWNSTMIFRFFLSKIDKKIKQELDDWIKIRKFDKNNRVSNQVEINKYILKRVILKNIISLFRKQMEKENTFLDRGIFPEEQPNLNAYELLLFFINNAEIEGKIPKQAFNYESTKALIDKIYSSIDEITKVSDVSNTTLKTTQSNAIQILKLQNIFLQHLNNYFGSTRHESYKIRGFINFMPYEKRLSSGESALLNLFSRIYVFLEKNLITNKFRVEKKHYILLLDEADLSFHPLWKKKYVKSLLKTIPHFFNKLDNKPSIQIIFTTHDPLTLSDLPNNNITYIERRTYDEKSCILPINHVNRPKKTFGANISELLTSSFFIEESLIGEFATDKISNIIKWLNNDLVTEDNKNYHKTIKIIDEPIVKMKLLEMYDKKMNTNHQIKYIDERIKNLKKRKHDLSKSTEPKN